MEDYRIYNIPANYTSGVPFLGKMFPVRNVVEAGISAAAGAGLIFLLRPFMQFTVMIAMIICTVILCMVIILPGIKGSSFLEYLRLIREYKKNRRVLVYNPRVKTEAEPVKDEKELIRDAELPRDRIMAMAQKMVPQQEETDISVYTGDNIVFEDDILPPPAEEIKKEAPAPRKKPEPKKQKEEPDMLPGLVIPKRSNA